MKKIVCLSLLLMSINVFAQTVSCEVSSDGKDYESKVKLGKSDDFGYRSGGLLFEPASGTLVNNDNRNDTLKMEGTILLGIKVGFNSIEIWESRFNKDNMGRADIQFTAYGNKGVRFSDWVNKVYVECSVKD